jgi:hypothetical protein
MVMSVQVHDPAVVPQERETLYLLNQETWWTTEPTWTLWKIYNLILPCRDSNQLS